MINNYRVNSKKWKRVQQHVMMKLFVNYCKIYIKITKANYSGWHMMFMKRKITNGFKKSILIIHNKARSLNVWKKEFVKNWNEHEISGWVTMYSLKRQTLEKFIWSTIQFTKHITTSESTTSCTKLNNFAREDNS